MISIHWMMESGFLLEDLSDAVAALPAPGLASRAFLSRPGIGEILQSAFLRYQKYNRKQLEAFWNLITLAQADILSVNRCDQNSLSSLVT
ncbi:hypothetical protein ACFLRO_01015 [Bacteroidota bacterium]